MKFQSILKRISYMCKMQGLNYETGKGYKIIPLRAKRVGEFIEIRHKKFHPPVY